MPTEENNTPPAETTGQEQQGQQPTTPETGGNGGQQPGTPAEPVTLADDHPLVKTLATQKQTIASQKTEMAELRAKSANVTKLEDELNARPTQEALDTLQTRYDRLEAFLQAEGGSLGKALDSRTFTRELFETDTDIADIVKNWHKSNPTATNTALGSGPASPADKAPNVNDLLRSALKK